MVLVILLLPAYIQRGRYHLVSPILVLPVPSLCMMQSSPILACLMSPNWLACKQEFVLEHESVVNSCMACEEAVASAVQQTRGAASSYS